MILTLSQMVKIEYIVFLVFVDFLVLFWLFGDFSISLSMKATRFLFYVLNLRFSRFNIFTKCCFLFILRTLNFETLILKTQSLLLQNFF